MRKLLRNSLIEIFIMCIVVVVISWFVFPEWRSKESGIIELVGVSFGSVAVILGVIVGISDLVNNSKDIAKEPELIPLQEVTLEEKERVHKKSDSKVTETTSILFLAADPTDASRLRLGEEFREIQEKLKLARLRDRFKLAKPQLSVRPTDISQALLYKELQVVHFAGHGTSSVALCF